MTNWGLSFQMQRAINFAAKAHGRQKRKASGYPFMIHPMAVGMILSRYNFADDIVTAGILHDVLEDTKTTKKQITSAFSLEIANIISAVSEKDKSLPWEERKREAIKHIEDMSGEALAVKMADAISNMMDLCEGYSVDGEAYFAHFKRGKAGQLARYSALTHTLLRRYHDIGQYFSTNESGIRDELQVTLEKLLNCF